MGLKNFDKTATTAFQTKRKGYNENNSQLTRGALD
jgi:hypothetical protein